MNLNRTLSLKNCDINLFKIYATLNLYIFKKLF